MTKNASKTIIAQLQDQLKAQENIAEENKKAAEAAWHREDTERQRRVQAEHAQRASDERAQREARRADQAEEERCRLGAAASKLAVKVMAIPLPKTDAELVNEETTKAAADYAEAVAERRNAERVLKQAQFDLEAAKSEEAETLRILTVITTRL